MTSRTPQNPHRWDKGGYPGARVLLEIPVEQGLKRNPKHSNFCNCWHCKCNLVYDIKLFQIVRIISNKWPKILNLEIFLKRIRQKMKIQTLVLSRTDCTSRTNRLWIFIWTFIWVVPLKTNHLLASSCSATWRSSVLRSDGKSWGLRSERCPSGSRGRSVPGVARGTDRPPRLRPRGLSSRIWWSGSAWRRQESRQR